MATWDGYNTTLQANRLQKTFVIDYIDLSGRLCVRQDTSMNNRLFVGNDASFSGNIYIDDFLTTNSKLTVNGDASLNNRLFVQNDVSFSGNAYINGNLTTGKFIVNADVSMNNRLFVQNDASFSGNTYINGNLILNGNLTVNGNASLNSNVIVYRDVSNNGNVFIGRDLTVLGNIAIQNYTGTSIINTTTTNYRLAVVEDISLNGRLSVSSDISFNSNLLVNGKVNVKSTLPSGLLDINGSLMRTFISATGNVGVGTTTPTAPLHVISTGDQAPYTNGIYVVSNVNAANMHSQLYITTPSGGGNPMICYEIPNKAGWSHGVDNADRNYKFSNSSNSLTSATRMTIQPDTGYIGIGTSNPSSFLHVYGNSLTAYNYPADFTSGYHNLLLTTSATTTTHNMAIGVDPSFRIGYFNAARTGAYIPICLQIRAYESVDDIVGIGTTNPSGAKLHVNGNVKINSMRPILGWATGSVSGASSGTVSFGVTFPSPPVVITRVVGFSDANLLLSVTVSSVTTTGFNYVKTYTYGTSGGTNGNGQTIWFAVLLG
jgi:cytoskeletal protein CcmA (bactofilin family)